jgi:hypothetical protein
VTTTTEMLTRSEIVEGLAHLSRRAAREMPVVGNTGHPTPWDLRHKAIDDLLDELERVGG